MAFEIDPEKLQTFYLHVLKASKKYHEKQIARKEVVKHLTHLKKLKFNKKYLERVNVLEQSIHSLVEKEKRILNAQKEESAFQTELKQKINALEHKLGAVLAVHEQREQKIKVLEKKIEARLKKREAYSLLQSEIEGLESMYQKLKRKGTTAPESLHRVEHKIDELKMRLRAV